MALYKKPLTLRRGVDETGVGVATVQYSTVQCTLAAMTDKLKPCSPEWEYRVDPRCAPGCWLNPGPDLHSGAAPGQRTASAGGRREGFGQRCCCCWGFSGRGSGPPCCGCGWDHHSESGRPCGSWACGIAPRPPKPEENKRPKDEITPRLNMESNDYQAATFFSM